MRNDKLYKILITLYRKVYSSIGIDFDSLNKEEHFYLNYEIDGKEEDEIINNHLSNKRLSSYQKQVIKINYYLGCSPKRKNT